MTFSTITNYPNGVSSFGMPIIGSGGVNTTGNVWFVSSVVAAANGTGGTNPVNPFPTLQAANDAATANNGDVVFIMPGHAETFSAAAGSTLSTAGVRYIGLGEGADRPTFTFGTDTAASIVISGASISIENIIGVAALDGLTKPFNITGADCSVSLEWYDASSLIEAATVILTEATADRLNINLKYIGFPAGNACVAPIKLVGGNDIKIVTDFYGLASTAVVNFASTACTNVEIYGYMYNSTDTTGVKLVVDTVGGSTWFATIDAGAAGAQFSGGSAAPLAADEVSVVIANQAVPSPDSADNVLERDVVGNKTDAAATGAVSATESLVAYAKQNVNQTLVASADAATNEGVNDVVGNKTDTAVLAPTAVSSLSAYAKGASDLQEKVALSSTAVMVDGNAIFTVAGGPIEIVALVSECVSGNNATASTVQYSVTPTIGSAQTISAASGSIANAAPGASITLSGTALSTAALYNANGPNLIANPGTIYCPAGTVNLVVGVGSTTGTWRHRIRYKPLATGVTVS